MNDGSVKQRLFREEKQSEERGQKKRVMVGNCG
jgi:hypothetical protein